MGLLNALQTSVSGMNAQSSYLSAIGDNIANSGTTGYKQAT
ncbi:MAG: flagellar basal body protein, partial [Beijerinckiaceae bacterium]|nr:flagellar basal body protein [Beijerinckiaceae bacterium]